MRLTPLFFQLIDFRKANKNLQVRVELDERISPFHRLRAYFGTPFRQNGECSAYRKSNPSKRLVFRIFCGPFVCALALTELP